MDACNAKPVTEEEVESMWALFGPPPILRSESKVGYYKLRKAFIRYFRPKDARQWSWVRELVDTQWEIHGHLRKRTLAVERYDPFWREHQYKTIFQHLQQAKKEAHELSPQLSEYECLQEFQGRLTSRIAIAERQLLELAQPNDSKDRLAYETAAKHVEKADKWLKNATQRRNTLLKILDSTENTRILLSSRRSRDRNRHGRLRPRPTRRGQENRRAAGCSIAGSHR